MNNWLLKKMRYALVSSKVFIRYIVTYATIMIFPFLIFGLFFFTGAINQIDKNFDASEQYKIDQLSSMMSEEFNTFLSIIFRTTSVEGISSNVNFWHYKWQNDKYYQNEIIYEIKKYINSSPLIEECVLYYRKYDTIFTSTAMNKSDLFFDKRVNIVLNQDEQLSMNDVLLNLQAITISAAKVTDLSSDKQYDALLFIVPFSLEKMLSQDVVMTFIISVDKLDSWTKLTLGSHPYRINLINDNNKLLVSYGGIKSNNELIQYDINNLPAKKIKQADGQNVSVYKSYSKTPKLTLVLEKPWDSTYLQLLRFRQLSLIIGYISIFTGFILVLLFSYYNYKPLRNTIGKLKSFLPVSTSDVFQNEYQQISNAFQSTISKNKDLEDIISEQSKNFKKEFLKGLLSGILQFDRIDKSFDVSAFLPGPYYIVMTIRGTVLKVDEVNRRLMEYELHLDSPFSFAAVDMYDYNCIAIIFGFPLSSPNLYHMITKEAYHRLNCDISLKAGVSSLRYSLGELWQCMFEAFLCLDYIIDDQNHNQFFYEDSYSKQLSLAWLPDSSLFDFTRSLQNGNLEQCLALLDNMLNYTKLGSDHYTTRIIHYPIVNAILTVIRDLHMESISIEANFIEITKNTSQFRNSIRNIIKEICNYIYNHRSVMVDDPIKQITKYVNEHYLDYDLSLEIVSSKYKISVPMISKLFKDRIGVGFKDYIINKRIETARYTLCSTTIPIREIALRVGYVNESHFIKIFKTIVGMTPAEYRKMFRSEV